MAADAQRDNLRGLGRVYSVKHETSITSTVAIKARVCVQAAVSLDKVCDLQKRKKKVFLLRAYLCFATYTENLCLPDT